MRGTAIATAALACLLLAASAGAAAKVFRPAPQGCAMSHCQPSMADQVGMPAPRSAVGDWFDPSAASNDQGLGCAGNGTVALCTFGNRFGDRAKPYMKAYNARGRALWDSGDALNSWVWTSVPIVGQAGGAVIADDAEIVRFQPDGDVRWRTPTPGGRPISPTRTANGTIVMASKLGPITAYDPRSGEHLATLDLTATLDGLHGRFDTTNTAGGRGNRIYVSTEFTLDSGAADPNRHARLYAIDVDPDRRPAKRLSVAWYYEFGARSGASPLVVGKTIVFDGDRETPSSPTSPRFFGIRDKGDRPKLLWQHPLENPGVASAALDSRGGAWVFAFVKRTLWRISTEDGSVLQSIDLDAVVDEPDIHAPLSAMSIATGPRKHPVMIVTARSASSVFVVAIDLVREKLLWKRQIEGPLRTSTPMGQFPVIAGRDGRLAVVFSTLSGIHAVVGPG